MARHHLEDHHRCPADIEEVRVNADRRSAEHTLPDLGQHLFDEIAGGNVGFVELILCGEAL